MYKKVEGNQRMTDDEASVMYPNDFILFRCDKKVISNAMGTVLYVGDNYGELSRLTSSLEEPSFCVVIEGLNHQRSLGGVVVGG